MVISYRTFKETGELEIEPTLADVSINPDNRMAVESIFELFPEIRDWRVDE